MAAHSKSPTISPPLLTPASARDLIHRLFALLAHRGQGDYLGENVSQLQHSLQAATLARNAGADDETVLSALLHDVGRFIPEAERMDPILAPCGEYLGKASHEVLGEEYLRRLGFAEKICRLVGAHVMAKRYLTAVDESYYEGVSRSSKLTLKAQGGPFDEEQVRQAQLDPLLEEKLSVRRWDDLAKDQNMKTPSLSDFEDMATASLLQSRNTVSLHRKRYSLPTKPTVVVCVDGFDPEYLDQGIADGILPNLAAFKRDGFHQTAHCAMPSFTKPNNVSIITGQPTAVHGINGNYFLDRDTGEDIMVVDDSLLRGSTILEQLAKRGVRVAAVTAKDKLHKILRHGLDGSLAICFSAEKAASCEMAIHGIDQVEGWLGQPQPSQYSAELSLFVVDAGIKLLEEDRADVCYLTLSDYIQHKHAPGSTESDAFLSALDQRIGRLVEEGAQVAVTGDHGMSAKSRPDGTPNVLFLEDAIADKFDQGSSRIICPITDPSVRHHGALGSFVRVHLRDPKQVDDVLELCQSFPEVDVALRGEQTAQMMQMPADREAEIVVVSTKDAVIGGRRDEHDLTNVMDHALRSHGGFSEQHVPLLMSRKAIGLDSPEARQWRNFDAFELVLNH